MGETAASYTPVCAGGRVTWLLVRHHLLMVFIIFNLIFLSGCIVFVFFVTRIGWVGFIPIMIVACLEVVLWEVIIRQLALEVYESWIPTILLSIFALIVLVVSGVDMALMLVEDLEKNNDPTLYWVNIGFRVATAFACAVVTFTLFVVWWIYKKHVNAAVDSGEYAPLDPEHQEAEVDYA